MRISGILITSLGLLAATIHAAAGADAPAPPDLSVQLPDTENNSHVYMFNLSKNGVSYKKSGAEFCSMMGYGKALLESPRDGSSSGDLVWVICRFPTR